MSAGRCQVDLQQSTRQEWIRQQNILKKSVITSNQASWLATEDDIQTLRGLSYVGGIDLSYWKSNPDYACASLAVFKFPEMELVYSNYSGIIQIEQPYIAGFLAFREVQHLIDCINKVKQEQPSLIPQVILVDGNGVLHHQEFGLACHLGVLTNIPTIGVAKNLLQIRGITRDSKHMHQIAQLNNKGDSFPLIDQSGITLGMAIKGSAESIKPIYVSVGHCIELKTAAKIVIACCKYRLPEPVRMADHLSREYLRFKLPLENQDKD